MTEKQRKIVWLAAVLIFITFMVLITIFVGGPLVKFAGEPAQFKAWVDSAGIWGRILFVGIVALQVVVAFIPGEPIELAAGYAFGFWEGSFLAMLGLVLGSWLIFSMVRKFGVKLVEVFFPSKKIEEFSFLKNPKKTKIIMFLLVMIPGAPKDFFSYFAGLTKMTTLEWLLIVAIGRIPSLITSTVTGAAAGEENYVLTVVMFAITALISLGGIIYYRWICKKEKEEQLQEKEDPAA
jgi:uncharacterized membrane protein YdjX (TVP38/TMEM64 family)